MTRPFGRREELPRVTISRGGRARSFTVQPWLLGTTVGVLAMFALGYLGATAYLVFRDGLMEASIVGNAQLTAAYEERLGLLRAELDRATSRHLIGAQSVESQVAALLDRQEVIARRQTLLDDLLAKARDEGLPIAAALAAVPQPRPPNLAADTDLSDPRRIGYAPDERSEAAIITGSIIKGPSLEAGAESDAGAEPESVAPKLRDVQSSLEEADDRQHGAIELLRRATSDEGLRLGRILDDLDLAAPRPAPALSAGGDPGVGGPFFAAYDAAAFVERAADVDAALAHVGALRRAMAKAPVRNPLPGAPATSRFGPRTDPFLGRPAFHTGVDFKAAHGDGVRATAAGTVRFAGWKGGYGLTVEVAHAHGLSTRYAHLSEVLVSRGDPVSPDILIGRVGSTGRSTGSHLHYETRRSGVAIDPATFLAAAQELRETGL